MYSRFNEMANTAREGQPTIVETSSVLSRFIAKPTRAAKSSSKEKRMSTERLSLMRYNEYGEKARD